MSTITSTTSTTSAATSSSRPSSSQLSTLVELRELAKARAAPTGKPKRADAKPKAPADECPALPTKGDNPKKRKEPTKSTAPGEEDEDTSSAPQKEAKRTSKKSQHHRDAARRIKDKQEKEKWTAQGKGGARARNQSYNRAPSKQICGSYNYQGCTTWYCPRAHVFDKQTQNAKAIYLAEAGVETQKGMKPNSAYAPELNDLRNRHVNTLTKAEKQALLELTPPLNPSQPKGSVLKEESKEPKRELVKQPKALTFEEQELLIRNGFAKEVKDLVRAQCMAFIQEEPPRHQTEEDRQYIKEMLLVEMEQMLAKLKAEHVEFEGACFMKQEMLDGARSGFQECPVYRHRFLNVPPNSLGPLDYFHPVNTGNQDGLGHLVVNLTKMLYDVNERRPYSTKDFNCQFCQRSLSPPRSNGHYVNCVYPRCMSVMYCSRQCRELNYEAHMVSCFTHPGWECGPVTQKSEEIAKAEAETLPARIPVNMEPGEVADNRFPDQTIPSFELIANAAIKGLAAQSAADADYQAAEQAAQAAEQAAQAAEETAQATGAEEEDIDIES